MKTKEIVRLTINYVDEFTFDDMTDAMYFIKLWKKGKSNTKVNVAIEIAEVPIAVEDPDNNLVYESVPTKGIDINARATCD